MVVPARAGVILSRQAAIDALNGWFPRERG